MSQKLIVAFMHFSQIIGIIIISLLFSKSNGLFIAPAISGIIIPLLIWLAYKQDEMINKNGKIIFNWMLSVFIYSIFTIPLLMTYIGMYFLVLLVGLVIVFSLIATWYTYNHKFWIYPFSIKFFSF